MEIQPRQKDKWFALIEEQERSGLSVSAFCKERHLKLSHMHHYRHLLKKQKEAIADKSAEKLVPIKINTKPIAAVGEIHLILSNGIHCIVPGKIDPNQLKAFVEVLMTC